MRRILTLAGMALATVAFAVPATASAQTEWLHNEIQTEEGEETLSGNVGYSSNEGLGGTGCNPAHVTFKITSFTTGEVTKFDCTNPATFGALKSLYGCEFEGGTTSVTAELPWIGHIVSESEVEITEVRLRTRMNPGCLVGEEINVLGGNVIATLTNPKKVTATHLAGTLFTEIGELVPEGTLTPAKSTYGIGS